MHLLAGQIVRQVVSTSEGVKVAWETLWQPFAEDATIAWGQRATWKYLADRGATLAQVMLRELPARIPFDPGTKLEERIEFSLGGSQELAIIDYYGPYMHPGSEVYLPAVLDFKTSDREYKPTAAELDEQLTDYNLAERSKNRPVSYVGLCVLIYGTNPKVQWVIAPTRPVDMVDDFIASAQLTEKQIREGIFQRNERSCFTMGDCPMIPLCYPSQRHRVNEELSRDLRDVTSDTTWEDE